MSMVMSVKSLLALALMLPLFVARLSHADVFYSYHGAYSAGGDNVSTKDFQLFLQQGDEPPIKEEIEAIVEKLDSNGDGVISKEEYIAWSDNDNKLTLSEVEAELTAVDDEDWTENEDELNSEKFKDRLMDHVPLMDDEALDRLKHQIALLAFKKADRNGNGKTDFTEVMMYFRKHFPEAEFLSDELLKVVDIDRDGVLSREEFVVLFNLDKDGDGVLVKEEVEMLFNLNN